MTLARNEAIFCHIYIFTLSVNEKLPVLNFRYFEKIYNTAQRLLLQSCSGQQRTSLEKNTSSTYPGTMVHVMHVLFVFLAVFEKMRISFSGSIKRMNFPIQYNRNYWYPSRNGYNAFGCDGHLFP